MKENSELNGAFVVIGKKIWNTKMILRYISIILVLIVSLGVGVVGYRISAVKKDKEIQKLEQKIKTMEETPVVLEPVTPEIVQKILEEKTKEISELSTAVYQFTNAAKFTDTSHIIGIFDWMTKKSFVQKWDGEIKAGIDLSKVKVKVENKIIKIKMPYPSILSYEIDYKSVEVLDEKNNVFNPITVKDKVNFDKETKEEMKNRAIKNGLLERASKNAENVITKLLAASIEDIEDYKIEFEIDKK